MSVPDENSTFCDKCSSYNLYSAILIQGEYICEGCLERMGLKELFNKLENCVNAKDSAVQGGKE